MTFKVQSPLGNLGPPGMSRHSPSIMMDGVPPTLFYLLCLFVDPVATQGISILTMNTFYVPPTNFYLLLRGLSIVKLYT